MFICANDRCRRALDVDHVTMITTAHVRRFCSVECITEGHELAVERAVKLNLQRMEDKK